MKFSSSGMVIVLLLAALIIPATAQKPPDPKPKVVILGVNGAELDILLPLLARGEMPNLAHMMKHGVSGRLRTISAPNCPKVYTTMETSTPPKENGITGFVVNGITANTNMLKKEPLWSILSKNKVTVGMANVPATFPVMPVNGYMISGMLTRGKNCETGVLCSPTLTQVEGGDAVYPKSLIPELLSKVGDFHIDCARMPGEEQLKGHEKEVVTNWLKLVDQIRGEQSKLFDYLLSNHPTDFTFLGQSCEDRVGHWLYPIQPFNIGYNPKVATADVNAFPNQYRALDKVIGIILKHIDSSTTFLLVSDHGIKPLRYAPSAEDNMSGMDHGTTPVIAKHDYDDGDEVPGTFVAMGPGIKQGVRFNGFAFSVFDIAPTVLHIYGIPAPKQMQGHVLDEIFTGSTVNLANQVPVDLPGASAANQMQMKSPHN